MTEVRVGSVDGYDVTIVDDDYVHLSDGGDVRLVLGRRAAQSLAAIILRELGPPTDGLYEAHPDVGRYAFTKEDVEFPFGVVVPKDSRGIVYRVEPGASTLTYLVKLDNKEDDSAYRPGCKGFDRSQINLGVRALGFGRHDGGP